MKHEESRLQAACVKWFRLQYREYERLLFAIPNGSKRNLITARILKAEGVRAGTADLMLAIPAGKYHGLFIEMKAGKNQQTAEQVAFQSAVQKAGYAYDICRSFDDFRKLIETYLSLQSQKTA